MPQIIHKDHIQPGMVVFIVVVDIYGRSYLITAKCLSFPYEYTWPNSGMYPDLKMDFKSNSFIKGGQFLTTLNIYRNKNWPKEFNEWKTFTRKNEAIEYSNKFK